MTTLDTAPAEILHAICAHLHTTQTVANLRSASKVLSEIGAHYLIKQVRFHTSTRSLDRLQNIADHKVFSQYIETVHFEANLLANISSCDAFRDQFEKHVHGKPKFEKPKYPSSPVTVREKRLYYRNLKKWQDLVIKKYDEYRIMYEAQQALHKRGPELMAEILPRFPRLQKVIFTIGRCPHALSVRFLEEFDTRLGYCAPLSIDTAPTGPQLIHIVAPAGKSLRNLQTLIISDLDPSIFKLVGASNSLQDAFVNLKKLDLSFRLPDKEEPSTEAGLYKVFQNGALRDAICSALSLEELRISFNDFTYDGPCVELSNILGEQAFPDLKSLFLGYIEADAKSFIETLKRQKNLKSLYISCVSIEGLWVNVLDSLQKGLHLEECVCDGFLSDDEQMYDMDHAEVEHYMVSTPIPMSRGLEAILISNTSRAATPILAESDDILDLAVTS